MHPPPPPLALPKHRWNLLDLTLLFFLFAVGLSYPVLEGSGRHLDYVTNARRFFTSFFPPDFSILPSALQALGETVQIAVMATFFSIILAIPLAVAGSQTISPRWLVTGVRLLMNGIRTIPSLIWALLGVAIVGANPLAGVIGLTFYSIGYLGKFFSDAFEAADLSAQQALRAIGADPIQAFQYGLWPNAKPLIWSHGLWMLEYNIRSASIIGYVGAGGVGLLLHTYQEYGWWPRFAAVLILIFVVVCALDFIGQWVRDRLNQLTKKE
jgi:phosphonate transport system permease protein